MNSIYKTRENLFRDSRQSNSELLGFSFVGGSKKAYHTILGEDHSEGAALAVSNAIRHLIIPKKTIILTESSLHGRNVKIENKRTLAAYQNYLTGWQHLTIDFLLENQVPLLISDRSSLLKKCEQNRENIDLFMNENAKREYTFAKNILRYSKDHQVIAIYGSLHVVSSVFDRILGTRSYQRCIYTGFDFR